MDIDVTALQRLLCERLCEEVVVEPRPDGALMVRTHFTFPDGDGYPFHLTQHPAGGLCLSDLGHTLMHISYDQDVDSLLHGPRRVLLDRVVSESGLEYDDGVFSVTTAPERLAESIFMFGQGLTRVYGLTLLSRTNVTTTFYDDLSSRLTTLIDEAHIQKDFEPDVPNAKYYPVDYCIAGKDAPVFLWGVPTRDKARLTTITLSYFHLHKVEFDSIIVFRDQAEIPRDDLARLSDVGGEMVSSLSEGPTLQRKISRRVAVS